MAELDKSRVESVIAQFVDPYLERDLVSSGCVREVLISGGDVRVKVVLGFPARTYAPVLAADLKALLEAEGDILSANVDVSWEVIARSVQQGLKRLAQVKNIIAVASGKGGVGKSTTAVNLALALASEGAQVGILDADIYGPSQPRMLGISGQPKSEDGHTMEPMMGHGLQAMSIGFLIEEDTPMIWRGPMVTQALEQLLNDTQWKALDYLVIDLPPGTGDTQLTLAQKVPVSGAVIVTTPQDIALLDARKGLKMFEKVEVPILGIVENMSTHICSACGHEEHIFGEGGGQRMATEQGAHFLGSLPLDRHIREQVDSGRPTVIEDPEGRIAQTYIEIGRKTAARLALQSRDYSAKFPKIVIQTS